MNSSKTYYLIICANRLQSSVLLEVNISKKLNITYKLIELSNARWWRKKGYTFDRYIKFVNDQAYSSASSYGVDDEIKYRYMTFEIYKNSDYGKKVFLPMKADPKVLLYDDHDIVYQTFGNLDDAMLYFELN